VLRPSWAAISSALTSRTLSVTRISSRSVSSTSNEAGYESKLAFCFGKRAGEDEGSGGEVARDAVIAALKLISGEAGFMLQSSNTKRVHYVQ
jgi:hypothetical protein